MNVDVLGRLAGNPFRTGYLYFLKRTCTRPLAMNETCFYLPEDRVSRLVTLYEYPVGGPLQPCSNKFTNLSLLQEPDAFSTGAGLCGPYRRLSKFCPMYSITESSTIIVFSVAKPWNDAAERCADLRGEIGFGMAWDVFRPQTSQYHCFRCSMRWGGMFGTDYIIDPEEQLIPLCM